MNRSQNNDLNPLLEIKLELDSSMGWIKDLYPTINTLIQKGITQELIKLCEILGIPASPAVSVFIMSERFNHVDQFIKVRVNNQLCLFSNDLLKRTYGYVTGIPLSPIGVNQISEGLSGETESGEIKRESDDGRLLNYLILTCIEIIKKHLSLLFGQAQAIAYHTYLSKYLNDKDSYKSTPTFDPIWLSKILKEVLDQGISIADHAFVAEVLTTGMIQDRKNEEIIEELIAALQTNIIEIRLPENFLREMTGNDRIDAHDKFELTRDGLYYELGLRFPDFQFKLVDGNHSKEFSFKINHLSTIPCIGLEKQEILVNDTMEHLKSIAIQGKPALNPAYWNEFSIIPIESLMNIDSSRYATWNQLEYLILCLSADLRENRIRFVNKDLIQNYVEQLESAFPKLVELVKGRYTLEQLTRIMRLLISEEISIRNFRIILESLLDYDYIVTDPSQNIVFDDRLPMVQPPDQKESDTISNLEAYVRTCLKSYISHKFSRGSNTLIVYLMDPEIEKWITENHVNSANESTLSPSYQDQYNKIIQAVYNEINETSSYHSANAILTSIDVREPLHKIIAPEFPQIPVIAYQELAPDISIQPISRISI